MSVIRQGNTGPKYRIGVPSFDVDGLPVANTFEDLSVNYTCTISVPTASPAISRAVTARSSDDFRFLAQLTPAETLTMAVGTHQVAIEVNDTTATPPFRVETHLRIKIEMQVIT